MYNLISAIVDLRHLNSCELCHWKRSLSP